MEANHNCIPQTVLKSWLAIRTDVVLIDVRGRPEYEEKHIPTALHIPLDLLAIEAKFLNHEKKYITICGKGGGRSAEAAQILKKAGLVSWWLCGGTLGWED